MDVYILIHIDLIVGVFQTLDKAKHYATICSCDHTHTLEWIEDPLFLYAKRSWGCKTKAWSIEQHEIKI